MELIYTGITRAKKHCSICTSKAQLTVAIKQKGKRISGLSERAGWKTTRPKS